MINNLDNIIENKGNIFIRIYSSKGFIWIIILLGILIRLRQYLFNRSLWLDEAYLAFNMIKLDYHDLLLPLLHGQSAPPAFLLITKMLTDIAGHSEYVLRFLPFVCGVASLVLFYYLSTYLLQKKVIPIAVSLLSFSYYAIYYSSEFKQYSVDLLFTIIIILFAVKLHENHYNLKNVVYFGIIGILSTWVSHASIFVLGGAGIALLFDVIITGKSIGENKINIVFLKKLIAIGIISIASFLVHYFLIIKPVPKGHFVQFWEESFISFPPLSFSDLHRYIIQIIEVIKNPLGLSLFTGIPLLLLIIGIYFFWNKKEKIQFNLLMIPLFILVLAAIFRVYPISGRLILFILPICYIIIAKGVEYFLLNDKKKIITIIIVCLLLVYPVYKSINISINPIQKQEMRQVVNYYLNNKAEGDLICLYYTSVTPFSYYTYGRDIDILTTIGKNFENPEKNYEDLEKLKGKGRVWFIFSLVLHDEDHLLLSYLNHIGNQLDILKLPGASAYLYDL
jgi:hypothetical protein